MLVFSGNGAHDHTFFRPVRARMMHRTRSSTKNRMVIFQDRAVLARRLCILRTYPRSGPRVPNFGPSYLGAVSTSGPQPRRFGGVLGVL